MVKPATPCIQDVTLCSRDASRLWPYRSSAGKARPSLLSQPQRSVRSCHSRHSQSKHSVVSIAVVSIAGVSHCTLYDSNSPHYIPRTCTLYDSNSPHYLPRTCTLYERNSRLCASWLGLGLGLGLGSGSGSGLGLRSARRRRGARLPPCYASRRCDAIRRTRLALGHRSAMRSPG